MSFPANHIHLAFIVWRGSSSTVELRGATARASLSWQCLPPKRVMSSTSLRMSKLLASCSCAAVPVGTSLFMRGIMGQARRERAIGLPISSPCFIRYCFRDQYELNINSNGTGHQMKPRSKRRCYMLVPKTRCDEVSLVSRSKFKELISPKSLMKPVSSSFITLHATAPMPVNHRMYTGIERGFSALLSLSLSFLFPTSYTALWDIMLIFVCICDLVLDKVSRGTF